MDLDELFEKFIEYDDEDAEQSSAVENSIIIKQPKTTKVQFEIIQTFMKEHDEKSIDKETYGLLWDNLAAKLNDNGPPDHTVAEWKRIWSVHMYNKKRKISMDGSASEEPGKMFRSDSDRRQPGHRVENIAGPSVNILQSDISIKIDTIINNQGKIIANQQVLMKELKSSNELLQNIADKFLGHRE